MDYCDLAPGHPIHGPYHDLEYGLPQTADDVLLERLSLEIMQAGLTWELVLRRREGLRAAFDDFHVESVAAYGEEARGRLLADPRIIRNRRKVDAIVENARRMLELRPEYGSLHGWLAAQHPLDLAGWVRVMKRRFVFMGPEVCREFLVSLGWLPGAHRPNCPVYERLAAMAPPWLALSRP
jgi:DNA-3-methyladenine glycosylase I